MVVSASTGPGFGAVPSELRGREVAVRALMPLWEAARVRDIHPEQLSRGTGYTVGQLTDTRERVSWSAYVTLLANLGNLVSDEELIQIGAATLRSRFLRAALLPARLLFTIPEVYLWAWGPNGPASQLFVTHEGSIQQVRPGHLRFETHMKAGYLPSRENYLLLRGTLQGLSAVLGGTPARVSQDPLADGAVYQIDVPQIGGVLAFLRAVTVPFSAHATAQELRRVNAELYERYAELQRQVEAREEAEHQRSTLEVRLQQSQRLESLGQLAGGVAHDFNNLLAVILNYATFLSEELADRPDLRADADEIARAAERAAVLTRQLLIFARRDVAHPEELDLNSVVSDMEKLLRRTIGEDIELVTRTAPDLSSVRADRGQIEQLLMNLIVNARDAMPKGGLLIIETKNVELDAESATGRGELPPGHYVSLDVHDTGDGMSPDVADRAFEPFFTTKPKGQGTGLGLATVYGIARATGGDVHIYSELGRGTRVSAHFPVAEGQPQVAKALQAEDLRSRGERVLLIEDEPGVRAAARRILSSAGYAVLEAESESTVVQLAADVGTSIDLLLTDVVMPGMSGIDLAALVRSYRPKVPVLFMSGYPQDVLAHKDASAADVSIVEKPFSRDALLRAVRNALRV